MRLWLQGEEMDGDPKPVAGIIHLPQGQEYYLSSPFLVGVGVMQCHYLNLFSPPNTRLYIYIQSDRA